MDAKTLEQYVHDHIPLTRAMGVEILEATEDKVVIFAPLEPNINHMRNIFGGSASTVAILAAWCLLFTKMELQGLTGHIVIRKNSMLYEKPISDGFTAVAKDIDPKSWAKLVDAVAKRRMARITVTTILEFDGHQVGQLEGEFVVLPDDVKSNQEHAVMF
jgi:thioesterase domain-containing protein